jgi:Tfp pilus assembly protein PilN
MIKINLLSEGKRPAAVRKSRTAGKLDGKDVGQYMLLVGIVIGLVSVGAAWWLQTKKNEAKEAEVAAAQHEVDLLASVIKEVDDYKAKKAELERKIGIINDLKLNQRGPVRVMDHVSRALPELLWLGQLGVTLFWVYDTSEGQQRTRKLVDGGVPLIARVLSLARVPGVSKLLDDILSLSRSIRA